MLFDPIKEKNKLISKAMSNIYVKVTKKWHTQNFDFLSLKSSSSGQFLGQTHADSIESKTVCGFSIIIYPLTFFYIQ